MIPRKEDDTTKGIENGVPRKRCDSALHGGAMHLIPLHKFTNHLIESGAFQERRIWLR